MSKKAVKVIEIDSYGGKRKVLPDNIKIRLTVDLTKYNPILLKGIEGVTIKQPPSMLDCYMNCYFGGVEIPVAHNGYEIIDEEYLVDLAELKVKAFNEYLLVVKVGNFV